jgi:hypothetical protein
MWLRLRAIPDPLSMRGAIPDWGGDPLGDMAAGDMVYNNTGRRRWAAVIIPVSHGH